MWNINLSKIAEEIKKIENELETNSDQNMLVVFLPNEFEYFVYFWEGIVVLMDKEAEKKELEQYQKYPHFPIEEEDTPSMIARKIIDSINPLTK